MSRFEYLGLKWRAIVWLVFGRPAQALQCFDAILQRLPHDPYALSSRANQHMQAGRLDAALADSLRLVQVRSEDAATWFNHGFILEALERWDEALAAFTRATELSPKLDRAWYGQGLVLIRLQRYEEAIVALKRNTELQPMSPYGWYQLARVHVDRSQPDEAVKIIRHLKGFEPKVAAQLERETGLVASSSTA